MRKTYLTNLFIALSIASSAQEKFKVGIVLYKTSEKVEATYNPLMEYVAKQIGREAEVNIVNEEDLAYYLNSGEYDLGVFTVFPYLKAKADFPDIKVFATHHVKGSDHFFGSILVKKNDDIEGLRDLKGKKFLFVKKSSTSGFKYPKGVFTENSIDIDAGFFQYDFSGGHKEAIMALATGQVDGIAVDETRFATVADIEKKDFKELERFKVPYHSYVFSPKLDVSIQDKLMIIFENAHKDPETRELWKNPLGITRWDLKNDEYYNLIRRYLRLIRVKPEVDIDIIATEKAQAVLDDLGDVNTVVERKIRRLMSESQRFSNKITATSDYSMELTLASTGGGDFSYQVKINNDFVTDGEVPSDSLSIILPTVALRSLLQQSIIKTNLLYNGSNWFITYGRNDGINLEDYAFVLTDKKGRNIILGKNEVKNIDGLNIVFDRHSSFYRDAPLEIRFAEEIKVFSEDFTQINTYNIFDPDFWKKNYWDKVSLIGGGLIAILSAIVGKLLRSRKKKRFKNILYQTNNLIKEYVDGHYKMEANLIEQKERISEALEHGQVNENQFMILQRRIEDMQSLHEVRQHGDVALDADDANEIADIVHDGIVTERDFSRIMNILRKSKTDNS